MRLFPAHDDVPTAKSANLRHGQASREHDQSSIAPSIAIGTTHLQHCVECCFDRHRRGSGYSQAGALRLPQGKHFSPATKCRTTVERQLSEPMAVLKSFHSDVERSWRDATDAFVEAELTQPLIEDRGHAHAQLIFDGHGAVIIDELVHYVRPDRPDLWGSKGQGRAEAQLMPRLPICQRSAVDTLGVHRQSGACHQFINSVLGHDIRFISLAFASSTNDLDRSTSTYARCTSDLSNGE